LNLLIQLPAAEIEKKLNAELGDLLHESGFDDPEQAAMQVRVKKRSPLRVRTADNLVVVSAPVQVWTRQGKRKDRLDIWKEIPLIDVDEVEFELTVHIRISLSIAEKWELKTQSSCTFEWDRKPRIGIGMMKFSVTAIVEPILEKELQAVAVRIDDFLQQQLDFPSYVRMAWEALQEAYEIDESVPAWLQLHPHASSVRTTAVVCHDHALQAVVAIELAPTVRIGVSHAPHTKKSLPFFRETEELPLASALPLTAVLPFHELDRLYRGHSYSFRKGKSRFQLDRLDFQVLGERLQVSLHLSGESSWRIFKRKHSGTLTLNGIPQCDPQQQSIVVTDLRYGWKSPDPILNLIFRLRKKRMEQTISQYVDHLLAATLQDTRRMIADAIRHQQLTPQVLLEGNIDDLAPREVVLEPGGITVVADARGKVSIRIEHL
jgi:hypothetical protein